MNIILINLKNMDELFAGCSDEMVRENDCPADTIAVVDQINGMIEKLIHDFDLLVELIEEKERQELISSNNWLYNLAERLVDIINQHPNLSIDCSGEVVIKLLNRFGDIMLVVDPESGANHGSGQSV